MTLDVTIRDMSDAGARLKVDATADVPSQFYFVVIADQLVARAKLAWRSPRGAGIEYLEPLRNIRDHPDPRVSRIVVG